MTVTLLISSHHGRKAKRPFRLAKTVSKTERAIAVFTGYRVKALKPYLKCLKYFLK